MVKKTRTRLSPDVRRAELLAHAMPCFAELGITRAGHGDIAKRAGVSNATVFNYFPTGQALRTAVTDYMRDHILAIFQTLPTDRRKSSEQVYLMAAAYQEIVENRPNLVKTFLDWSVCFRPDLRKSYQACQDLILDHIATYLADSQDPQSDARIIHASANIFATMILDGTPEAEITKFVDRIALVLDAANS